MPGDEEQRQRNGILTSGESAATFGDQGANVGADRTGVTCSVRGRNDAQKRSSGVSTPTIITATATPRNSSLGTTSRSPGGSRQTAQSWQECLSSSTIRMIRRKRCSRPPPAPTTQAPISSPSRTASLPHTRTSCAPTMIAPIAAHRAPKCC